jgi:hypothetical protein
MTSLLENAQITKNGSARKSISDRIWESVVTRLDIDDYQWQMSWKKWSFKVMTNVDTSDVFIGGWICTYQTICFGPVQVLTYKITQVSEAQR